MVQSTVPACRLVNGMTWDRLLAAVSTLVFSYKRLCSTWSLALGLAAARLGGGRRLLVAEQATGYSVVWIYGEADAAVPDGHGKCTAACGACAVCLAAQQVTAPGCAHTSNG